MEVADTGHGIADDQMDRIFDPFTQLDETSRRSHYGVGLGLSIAREIAKLHGGNVTARRSSKEGSVFRLELNAVRAVADQAA